MSMVPLHLETSYSMRGSNIAIESLLNKALEYGYTSLAICDHKLYGMISFYNACKSKNIKPILGLHIIMSALIGERSNHIFLYASVFIVGMPRSGSTLVEQILASHSKVISSGTFNKFGAVPSAKLITTIATSQQNVSSLQTW